MPYIMAVPVFIIEMETSFDINSWIGIFREKISAVFGDRLCFLGLQGSYGRGEQKADSDIDVVVILDEVNPNDLEAYRDMIETLPQNELICGFVAGKKETAGWDKADMLNLVMDTRPILGNLDCFIPEFSDEDIRRSVLTGACNVYHACSHNFLHAKSPSFLAGLFKSARFTVRMKHYYETGEYIARMKDLYSEVAGKDRTILEIADGISSGMTMKEFGSASRDLLEWSSGIITGLQYHITFRTLTEGDIPEMKRLFRDTVLSVNIQDYTEEEALEWASCADIPGRMEKLLATLHFIGATGPDGKIVGYTSMRHDGYLHSMFVHKDHQSKGIATALLNRIEKYASGLGISQITSEVSITARPFFEHRGYTVEYEQKPLCRRLYLTNFRMKKDL